jgi:hypothetical protein
VFHIKIKFKHSSNTSTTFTKYPPGYMFRPTWAIFRPHRPDDGPGGYFVKIVDVLDECIYFILKMEDKRFYTKWNNNNLFQNSIALIFSRIPSSCMYLNMVLTSSISTAIRFPSPQHQ